MHWKRLNMENIGNFREQASQENSEEDKPTSYTMIYQSDPLSAKKRPLRR